jgi:spore germination protein GerM
MLRLGEGLLIYCLCLIAFFSLTGCNAMQTGQTKELPYLREKPETIDAAKQPLSSAEQERAQEQDGSGEQTGKTTPVVLYFADNDGLLVAFKKEIPKATGIARRTLQELGQGPPADSGLYPTIPSGAKLKDINIKNDLATVDFNQNLKSRHWGGSTGEMLTVYSIVNTLTQFPAIKEVQILIEGERVQTLAGHLDISKPLKRNSSLIKAKLSK